MESKQKQQVNPKLAVALDFSSSEKALSLVSDLKGLGVVYKIGLELFISSGPSVVRNLVSLGEEIFLDLKLFDIPNTVSHAALMIADLKVKWMTVHVLGGEKMLGELTSALRPIIEKPRLIGVTVLTSFSDCDWKNLGTAITGQNPVTGLTGAVKNLVSIADKVGLDGVVCSAKEVQSVKVNYPNLFTIVPGIRLENLQVKKEDQTRVLTPFEAAKRGADMIVMGRPITESPSPRNVVEKVIIEIKKGHDARN